MVTSATLDASSWIERTCAHEGGLAYFPEKRTTWLEFGRLSYVTIAQTEHRSSRGRLLIFLLFSLVLLMELLHAPSFLHVYGRVGRTRNLHIELTTSTSTYIVEVNLFGLLLLGLACKGLVGNISNNFIFEFVLLVRVSLK